MINVLMTGSTGFIGSNVLPILQESKNYNFFLPKRCDLDLKDSKRVEEYLKQEKIDVVLHLANPNPARNNNDSIEKMTEDSLRIFMNFFSCSRFYKKMIYLGSGAEFDKTMDMNLVKETECYRSIPKDSYGFAKYIMNQMSEKSDNVYNFRIFGCYGPGDAPTKFITHCIRSILLGKEITIRKDCEFDYLHVYDLARFLDWGISADLKKHNYNVTYGIPVLLSEIANIVRQLMDSNLEIRILSDEKNKNYTACNKQLLNESKLNIQYSLQEGIKKQIEWEKSHFSKDTIFDGE